MIGSQLLKALIGSSGWLNCILYIFYWHKMGRADNEKLRKKFKMSLLVMQRWEWRLSGLVLCLSLVGNWVPSCQMWEEQFKNTKESNTKYIIKCKIVWCKPSTYKLRGLPDKMQGT